MQKRILTVIIKSPQNNQTKECFCLRKICGILCAYFRIWTVCCRARAEVIKILANARIKVHTYGNGWSYLNYKQENLTLHDRVYSAMLNEGVCLTDGSEYWTKQFLTAKKQSYIHWNI